MTDIVPADQIEAIVGITRHPTSHYARAVSAEQVCYVLHSHDCLLSGRDLRDCPFSLALDAGLDLDIWDDRQDTTVEVSIDDGLTLIPTAGDPP